MKLNGINKTVVSLVAVVLTMGALGWASVPLYDWFCRVTGYGGETSTATAGSDEILERTVKVRLRRQQGAGIPLGVQAHAARNGTAHRGNRAGLL